MPNRMRITTIALSLLGALSPLIAQVPIPTQEFLFPHMVLGGDGKLRSPSSPRGLTTRPA